MDIVPAEDSPASYIQFHILSKNILKVRISEVGSTAATLLLGTGNNAQ